MRRSLTLALGELGGEALAAEAERYRLAPEELVRHAARYYLAERGSGRAAHRVPRFARRPAGKPGTGLDVEVELPPETWRQLEGEARAQGVSLEVLLEHAALFLIADLESGRVARRLLEDGGEGLEGGGEG